MIRYMKTDRINHARWDPNRYKWSYGAPIHGMRNGYWGYNPTYRSCFTPVITGRGPPGEGDLLIFYEHLARPVER